MFGTCKLCLSSNVELRNSHFFQRSFYELMRTPESPTIHISPESIYPSVKQTKDYVFCGDCEQRFGRAEAWIKPLLPAVGGPFPLREVLLKQEPMQQSRTWSLFETASNPGISAQKLTEYAIGLFFKGAVHHWGSSPEDPYLPLAPNYTEVLRLYLLGRAGLPSTVALCVTVDSLPQVWQAMIQPYPTEPQLGLQRYVFYIPGTLFQLFVGEHAQDLMWPNFNVNPSHPILIEDISHPMRNTARSMTVNAYRAKRLLKDSSEIEAKTPSIYLGG